MAKTPSKKSAKAPKKAGKGGGSRRTPDVAPAAHKKLAAAATWWRETGAVLGVGWNVGSDASEGT